MTADDRVAKRESVLAMLEARDASSLLLTSTAAVSWYLDGARVHIALSAAPVLSVRVTFDADEVYLGSNEAGRMLAEELPPDVTVVERPWYGSASPLAELTEADVARELRDLRRVLTAAERERFRRLGSDAAMALTATLQGATPSSTGFDLAGALAGRIVAAGADPLVVLVDGASRSGIRHPLPTGDPIGRRAMLVVCARRHGLIANATRWVRFGAATAEEADADARILEVESDIFGVTRPGAELGEVLATIAAAYPENGFAVDEWLRHHQGGSAGYETREALAVPHSDEVVALGQAFAWNPTAPGAKVEDTVLVTETGVEPLTVDPRWPTTTVRGVDRPAVLEL